MTIEELAKSCPCPVHMDVKPGHEAYSPWHMGVFDYSDKVFIAIMSYAGSRAKKFAMLAHEKQHAICYKTNCFCYQEGMGRYYREYHAFLAELRTCIKHPHALKYAMQHMEWILSHDIEGSYHQRAVMGVTETALWRKALTLI